MTNHNEVELRLSQEQIKKALKGTTFQATAESLKGEPNVVLAIHNKNDLNRLIRNAKAGKGFRFQTDSYKVLSDIEGNDVTSGEGIFKKIAKKAVKVAKKNKIGHKTVNYAIDRVEGVTGIQEDTQRKIIKNARKGNIIATKSAIDEGAREYAIANQKGAPGDIQGGNILQKAKKAVRKRVKKEVAGVKDQVKENAKQFLTNAVSTGVPGLVSAATLAAAPEAAWAVPIAAAAASKFVAAPINKKIVKTIDGMGVKFKKGSQEAKDHMAMLRAKRTGVKKTSGSGIKMDIEELEEHPSITKKCCKKAHTNGSGLVQPVGNGGGTRLSLIKPEILRNKEQGKTSGGSFRAYGEGVYGGSFMPA